MSKRMAKAQTERPLELSKRLFLCLKNGAGEGSRTLDLLFTKQLLCH